MPRTLTLSLDGKEFAVELTRIDREKLYGKVEIEAFDEKGKPAELKVLAADGRTLIDRGGTALEILNSKGNSIERSELVPVDIEGEEIERVPSSFDQTNVLKDAAVDDYLSLLVKSVYVLDAPEGSDLDYLQDHLSGNQIFTFPFSYRGGIEYDAAYIVGNGPDTFMVVGKDAELRYLKLNESSVLDSVDDVEISADEISFDLI